MYKAKRQNNLQEMGLKKAKNIFLYSDSEPNEVLISLCHLICLPLSICMEYDHPNYWLILVALFAGFYQLWAVLYSGTLKSRLNAVKLACLVALATIINLSMVGLMEGSRTGWIIIFLFACWNVVRVQKENIARNG